MTNTTDRSAKSRGAAPGNDWPSTRRGLTLCLAIATTGTPASALALGVRIPNQDASAIARGNAFVATADNPSALYYNPAGITQLPGHNVQLGVLNYMGINTDFRSTTGRETETEFEVIPVPQLYYTYTLPERPLSFGLGLYAPFGLGVEWPEDSGFRTMAIESRLTYITLNPVVAYKPHSTLSVAIGPTFNYSKTKLRTGLISPTPNPNDEFEFEGDGFAYGFNAGLLWQPVPKWSFGVNYRAATAVEYDGDTTIRSPIPLIPSGKVDTSATLDFPQIVSFGVSFRPTERWNFEINADYSDWTTLNTVVFDGTSDLFGANLTLPLNWDSSWFYEFGATHYFLNGWYVSAGYFFSEATAPDKDFTPAVPDTDLHVGSIGVGYKGKRWTGALASQLIAGPWRDVRTSPSSPADGSYKLIVPTLVASIGFHF